MSKHIQPVLYMNYEISRMAQDLKEEGSVLSTAVSKARQKAEQEDLFVYPMAQAKQRATEGAIFLDSAHPDWWRTFEKPINVGNTKECPLAQLYGRYKTGIDALGLDEAWALEFGFRGCKRELRNDINAFRRYYKELNQAWEEELKIRKGEV